MIRKYLYILSEFLSAVSLSWCQLSRLTFVGEDTCENSLSENAKSGFSLSCFAKLETNQFFDDIGSFNIDKIIFTLSIKPGVPVQGVRIACLAACRVLAIY